MTVWLAAVLLIAAVAMFVAAPLADGLFGSRARAADAEREQLEHRRSLAVQGLRELAFDHEMGKLDDGDYQTLRAALEQQALAAMSALESASNRAPPRVTPLRSLFAVNGRAAVMNFCPQCGVGVGIKHKFCVNCGVELAPAPASQAQ